MTAALRNVTLRVELGFGSGALTATPTWTDVTDDVIGFTTKRGRNTVLDRFAPGTGGLHLRNHDGKFDPINTASPYSPNVKVSTPVRIQVEHQKNLLTENQASLETDTTGWIAFDNVSIARTTAQALHGVASLQATTAADGTATPGTLRGTSGVVVSPSTAYTALCSITSSVARTARVYVSWFDAAGAAISDVVGATLATSTSSWTELSVTATSPSNAAFASIQVQIFSTLASEVHYLDQAGLFQGSSATWVLTGVYTLFRGAVASWPLQYESAGKFSEVDAPIEDMSAVLANASLTGISYPKQGTGARIIEVLDDIGWPAALRDIDTGVAEVAAGTPGGKALDHINDVVAVEAGQFFVAGDGTADFIQRVVTAPASRATFDEIAATVRYEDLARSHDKDALFNVVEATRPGGVTQTASDVTSKTQHGPTLLTIDGPFVDDNAALNVAEVQVRRLANTVDRITSLRINPDYDPSVMWPVAAGTELRERVTVKFQPPGGGTALNQLSSVEGVEHSWSALEGLWKTTFRVWPLTTSETDSYWVLGTSALDTEARLA